MKNTSMRFDKDNRLAFELIDWAHKKGTEGVLVRKLLQQYSIALGKILYEAERQGFDHSAELLGSVVAGARATYEDLVQLAKELVAEGRPV